jgi:hypothetical protein
MIIFGTRSMNSRSGNGAFHCPRCGMERHYMHYVVKQWFTLYFIPVIPMGARGEFVECTSCAGTFGVEVLQYNPETERREALELLRRFAALALGESGKLQAPNIAALCRAMDNMGAPCTESQIYEDWRLATQAKAQLESYARNKVNEFSDKGRILVLQLCIYALRGGSELEPQSFATLQRLARGLNVTDNAVGQLLTDEYRLLT